MTTPSPKRTDPIASLPTSPDAFQRQDDFPLKERRLKNTQKYGIFPETSKVSSKMASYILNAFLLLVVIHLKFNRNITHHAIQREMNSESLSSLNSNNILVRCFWTGTDTLLNKERLYSLNASICPRHFCQANKASQQAYSDFLVMEAIGAEKGVVNKTTAFHWLVQSNAQCLFWEQQQQELCSCEYPSLIQFCEEFKWGWSRSWKIIWNGDSTIHYFKEWTQKACNQLRKDTQQQRQLNETNALPTILITNDKTMHKLYLPFFRESDRKCKTCLQKDQNFDFSPGSMQEYLTRLEDDEEAVEEKFASESGNLQLVVYMSNNYVCDHLYTGNYSKAVRFLLENPNVTILQELMQRRHADGVATLGLTLDYYGSQFASTISRQHIFGKMKKGQQTTMRHWVYLPFPGQIPSMCELSLPTDGRHYMNPEIEYYNFYVVKARILHYVVTEAIDQITNVGAAKT